MVADVVNLIVPQGLLLLLMAYVVNVIVNRLPQLTVLLTIKCKPLPTLPIVILLKRRMEIWDKCVHSFFVYTLMKCV